MAYQGGHQLRLLIASPYEHETAVARAAAVFVCAVSGQAEDFLVAHIDPDDDDAEVLVLDWSDIAASIAEESPEAAAPARLAKLGGAETQLRTAMARKIVHPARLSAIGEFR